MAANKGIFDEKVWKPFGLKYYVEAALQAQNICIAPCRSFLEMLIRKELKAKILFEEKEEIIISKKLSEMIKDIPDRKLFERLQKHFKGKIEEHIFSSLLKFNDEVRRIAAHNLGSIDEANLKSKLEQMDKNYASLLQLISQLILEEFSDKDVEKIMKGEKITIHISP